MKIDLKKLPKSQVQLTITVPYERYKQAEREAIKEAGQHVKVDGFRAGHIPEEVIREKVEAQTLMAVAAEKLIIPTYAEAVQQHELLVIAQPQIEILKKAEKEGDDFVYTATVAVMPEVKVGNYRKIKVKKPEVKVDKKQVEETLSMIMDRFAEWRDVDRKAKKGDRAEVNFEGFDEKGEAIPNTASKNHPIILGSNTMVPGFEDAIMGMAPKEEKSFDVTFPKDYHAKPMRGKKVTFKVTLGRLEEKKEQELNEAMIEKILGEKQSVEDFKKRVEDDLKAEMEQRARQEHDGKVVREIIKITKAEIPEPLIEDELKVIKEDTERRIKQQGLSWEQYLQHMKKTEEDFKKDHHKVAEERLLARLGVQEIVKDAGLEPSDEEAEKKAEEIIRRYPEEQREKAREYYKEGGDGFQNLKSSLAAEKMIEMMTK